MQESQEEVHITSSIRTTTGYSGRTSSARTTGTGYRRTTRSTSTSTLTNTVSTRTTWYSGTWSSYQSYTLLWTGTNYYSWGGHDTWTDSQIGNEWHANGNASFSRTILHQKKLRIKEHFLEELILGELILNIV